MHTKHANGNEVKRNVKILVKTNNEFLAVTFVLGSTIWKLSLCGHDEFKCPTLQINAFTSEMSCDPEDPLVFQVICFFHFLLCIFYSFANEHGMFSVVSAGVDLCLLVFCTSL